MQRVQRLDRPWLCPRIPHYVLTCSRRSVRKLACELGNVDHVGVEEKEKEKQSEATPAWVSAIPRVVEKGGGWVRLPGVRGLPDEHDQGLSEDFWSAGILVEEPHLRLH